MFLKVYKLEKETLVAVCDEKYIGRELSDGDIQLKVSKDFYGCEKATKEEIIEALNNATIANLVGEESVALAVEIGLIETSHIIFICDVPHAQMVLL